MHGLYSPVVQLPSSYEVFDFGRGSLEDGLHGAAWGVGKYNERRENVYERFFHGKRNVHIGVDLFAPAGTPVRAFADGRLRMAGMNRAPGDYGATLMYEHELAGGGLIHALYGHLSIASLVRNDPGQLVEAGEVIGWTGEPDENGGWPPHVHFQLARTEPTVCDMPGVVAAEDLAAALQEYPDPRMVLGPIY